MLIPINAIICPQRALLPIQSSTICNSPLQIKIAIRHYSYSSEINAAPCYILRGWKKRIICPQRALLPNHAVGYYMQQPAEDKNGCLAHFFLIWTCCVGYLAVRCRLLWLFGALKIFKKSAPNGLNYLQQAATPGQIIQQNSLHRAGGP